MSGSSLPIRPRSRHSGVVAAFRSNALLSTLVRAAPLALVEFVAFVFLLDDPWLAAVFTVVTVAVFVLCHAMNARINARFEDHKRKLQAVRTASLEVHEADRNLHRLGRSDPAALHALEQALEQAWDRMRRADAVAKADRFPRRPKPGGPEPG